MSDPLLECAGLSAEELRDLLGLIAAMDIEELDVSFGSARVSVRRATPVVGASKLELPPAETPSVAITSPLVGMFHPSVEVGMTVEAGQSIGAIEALGMPTSVEAPHSGTVEELLVEDGLPVEYGQPLVILRRAVPAHAS